MFYDHWLMKGEFWIVDMPRAGMVPRYIKGKREKDAKLNIPMVSASTETAKPRRNFFGKTISAIHAYEVSFFEGPAEILHLFSSDGLHAGEDIQTAHEPIPHRLQTKWPLLDLQPVVLDLKHPRLVQYHQACKKLSPSPDIKRLRAP